MRDGGVELKSQEGVDRNPKLENEEQQMGTGGYEANDWGADLIEREPSKGVEKAIQDTTSTHDLNLNLSLISP